MWVLFAFGSAFFAGVTAILSKIGIKNTDSNLATAIRTIVVLIFSWLMVFIVGSFDTIKTLTTKTIIFLILSGLVTGLSWLCYFRALQLGNINKVTPIDKSSTILTMILAMIFLNEKITVLKVISIVLIGVGTYLMIEKKTEKISKENKNQFNKNTIDDKKTKAYLSVKDDEILADSKNLASDNESEKIGNGGSFNEKLKVSDSENKSEKLKVSDSENSNETIENSKNINVGENEKINSGLNDNSVNNEKSIDKIEETSDNKSAGKNTAETAENIKFNNHSNKNTNLAKKNNFLTENKWLIYAVGSAVFASLTSILGKIGIEGVESNLGTAIRTIVVLIMAWVVVFVTKKQKDIKNIDKKSWKFLLLSGLATGLSWLCYYKALQTGEASIVVPIDKLSIVITMAFSFFVLKKKFGKKSVIGFIGIIIGTLLLLI